MITSAMLAQGYKINVKELQISVGLQQARLK